MGKTIRILPIMVLVGSILYTLYQYRTNWRVAMSELVSSYSGYSITEKKFTPDDLMKGLVPLIVAVIVSMLFSKAGLNRYMPGKGWAF